ncbi:MAG: hypothetical protein ACKO40_12880 [Planctomycetaceae bacterium]
MELTSPRPARVIVLGASNVSRGLARLATVVRQRTSGPVDLVVAAGHGRSYGVNSRVAMRRLPSILGSGLWRSLERQRADATPPLALLTDIGNDLLYGFPAPVVAEWVGECLRRLSDFGTRMAITRVPLASVAAVGPARYRAFRSLFVPGCRLSLAAIKEATADLDAHLAALAAEHAATLIDQPGDWYGFDPIHPRRRHLSDLFHTVGDAWGLPQGLRRGGAGWRDWAVLGSRAAEIRSLARRVRFTPQPVVARGDLRVWMY